MSDLLNNNTFRVGAGLVIGLILIMYFNPPHTPCQSQIEIYKQGLKSMAKVYKKAMDQCREHPEPGGCVNFFETINKMEGKFNEVTRECQTELAGDTMTKSWISTSMELMARLAWGSKPPDSYIYRQGWL